MNALIQHFMKLSDPEQIFNIEGANFQDLSFSVYSKDLKGKYLSANHSIANMTGFATGNDLIGLTDFDFSWSKQAGSYIENDAKVKAEKKSFSFIEEITLHTKELFRVATLKAPLRGNSKKILGIIGLTFILEEVKGVQNLFPELSNQQIKCLYYLVQGMTMKQISYVMGLSSKTIEHYLEAVKMKLNCRSRSELIRHAINLGILQHDINLASSPIY